MNLSVLKKLVGSVSNNEMVYRIAVGAVGLYALGAMIGSFVGFGTGIPLEALFVFVCCSAAVVLLSLGRQVALPFVVPGLIYFALTVVEIGVRGLNSDPLLQMGADSPAAFRNWTMAFALAAICASVALSFVPSVKASIVAAVLAVFCAAAGFLQCVGEPLGLFSYAQIPPFSAIGFQAGVFLFVLGGCLLREIRKRALISNEYELLWRASTPIALMGCMFAMAWMSDLNSTLSKRKAVLEKQTQVVRDAIEQRLNAELADLEDWSAGWQQFGAPGPQQWRWEAEAFMRRYPSLRGLGLVSSVGQFRRETENAPPMPEKFLEQHWERESPLLIGASKKEDGAYWIVVPAIERYSNRKAWLVAYGDIKQPIATWLDFAAIADVGVVVSSDSEILYDNNVRADYANGTVHTLPLAIEKWQVKVGLGGSYLSAMGRLHGTFAFRLVLTAIFGLLLLAVLRKKIADEKDVMAHRQWAQEFDLGKQAQAELQRKAIKQSEFAVQMSSELRNPLSAITGLARLLLSTRLGVKQQELVHAIGDASNCLQEAINKVLAKMQAPNQTSTPSNQTNVAGPQTAVKKRKKNDSWKVLVAEDDEVNQQVIEQLLTHMGYLVTVVTNGKQAVEMWETKEFGIVLMDCQMPQMDGYEATRQIRQKETEQKRQRMPVIALSGDTADENVKKARSAGADDFLGKPFTPEQLDALLQKWFKGGAAASSSLKAA